MGKSPGHIHEAEDQSDSAESTLSSLIDQLGFDNHDERSQAAISILELSPGKTPNEIAQIIYHSKRESTLEIFGWIGYCMDHSLDISIDWIEAVCIEMMKHYSQSVAIILHGGDSERVEDKKSALADIRGRMKELVYVLTQKKNEEVKNYGYLMTLKLLDVFEEDISRIQAFYNMCPPLVQLSVDVLEILADGYERSNDYPRAYEIYHTLQVRTGEACYLGSQISLLYKMGRVDEARSLYAFGSSAGIHGNILFPEFFYRGTIERDRELREIYKIFLPLYKGDRIDDMTKKFMIVASEYVRKRLSVLEEIFSKAEKKNNDIYDTNFVRLWVEKLFLLEVAVGMLGYTGPFGPFPEGVGMEYILTLRDLYGEHQEVPNPSILDHYFSLHSQEWMDKVRDLQGDNTQDLTQNDQEEGGNDDRNFVAGNESNDPKDFFVTQRLDNILDFLLDRVENDQGDNQELLDEIIEFQSELSEHSKDIPAIDISDVRFAGDLVRKSLSTLSVSDRQQYNSLVEYTREHYGPSILQFLFFLSANTSHSDEMSLQGIQKDPRLLLLSIVITLLSVENPPLPRIREFITNPIFEALGEGETIFLCRMLYRAGLFREVCLFLLEDREAFGYAECVEIFFQSLSFLDRVTQEQFYDGALDTIDELFDYRDFSDFLEDMQVDLPETEPHVLHAKMILATMTDDETSLERETPSYSLATKLTPHQASMRFTTLRCMEVGEGDREKWTRALMDIYPLLDIDKKQALEAILTWLFYLGWKDEIERFVALGQKDGLSIGYWKYAYLLLGDQEQQKEGIDSIVHDPFLHIIPEPFIWWIDNNFPHELDQPIHGKHTIVQKFQLSYIRAYSGFRGRDKLERIASHFHSLNSYIALYMNGNPRLDASSVEAILDLFDAVDYDIGKVSDGKNPFSEDRVAPLEKLADILVRHIGEFRRYLSLSWDEEVDGDIMSSEARNYCLQFINSLESIVSGFDPSSLEYLRLSVILGQLRTTGWLPSHSGGQNDGLCDDWRGGIPQGFS